MILAYSNTSESASSAISQRVTDFQRTEYLFCKTIIFEGGEEKGRGKGSLGGMEGRKGMARRQLCGGFG